MTDNNFKDRANLKANPTFDSIMETFKQSEAISPAWERPLIFSWAEMLFLKQALIQQHDNQVSCETYLPVITQAIFDFIGDEPVQLIEVLPDGKYNWTQESVDFLSIIPVAAQSDFSPDFTDEIWSSMSEAMEDQGYSASKNDMDRDDYEALFKAVLKSIKLPRFEI